MTKLEILREKASKAYKNWEKLNAIADLIEHKTLKASEPWREAVADSEYAWNEVSKAEAEVAAEAEAKEKEKRKTKMKAKMKAADRLARKSSELAIELAAAKEKADVFLKARTAP